MRKLFVIIALLTLTCSLFAAEPVIFTGKPPIEKAKVELFARTMAIAQGRAKEATTALKDASTSPENASNTNEAIKAVTEVLQLGREIVESEKIACAKTGMSDSDFHEVKIRLVQVRMFQNMEAMKTALVGERGGGEMAGESLAKIDEKLATLEARVQKSRESLDKAKSDEAAYFAKQDSKIAEQKEKIEKLQTEIPGEKTEKKREAKQKQLNSARERLIKMESERQKPFKTLINAQERLDKDEKSAAVFRANMADAKKQIETMGQEIEQHQEKIMTGFAQTADSEIMKQAALDLQVFQQFPDLRPFLVVPGN